MPFRCLRVSATNIRNCTMRKSNAGSKHWFDRFFFFFLKIFNNRARFPQQTSQQTNKQKQSKKMGLKKKKKKGKTPSAVNALSHIVSRRENQMYNMYTIEDKQNNRQPTIYNEWERCVCVCGSEERCRRSQSPPHGVEHFPYRTARSYGRPQDVTTP